eukprot:g1796.t1
MREKVLVEPRQVISPFFRKLLSYCLYLYLLKRLQKSNRSQSTNALQLLLSVFPLVANGLCNFDTRLSIFDNIFDSFYGILTSLGRESGIVDYYTDLTGNAIVTRPSLLKLYRETLKHLPGITSIAKYKNFETRHVPTHDGKTIEAYVWTINPKKSSTRPVLLFHFHSGGMCIQSALNEFLDKIIDVAYEQDRSFLIVSPEYRMSPENPFPIPIQDCVSTVKFFTSERKHDEKRVCLSGASAGGAIVSAVAMTCYCEKLCNIRALALAAPMMSPGMWSRSKQLYGATANFFGYREREWFWRQYLRDCDPSVLLDPLCCPLYAKDELLTGSFQTNIVSSPQERNAPDDPSVFLLVGSMDPLRDEGLMFADRLKKLKITVHTEIYRNKTHVGVLMSNYQTKDFYRKFLKKACDST